MWVLHSLVRSVALSAASFGALSLMGCIDSSFGGSASGYDQQGCLERALRRNPDLYTVKTARDAFEDECGRGGPEACSALGVMNEIGLGVRMNPKRAVALYDRACQSGNVRGCTNLAIARAEGIGGPRQPLFGARVLGVACDRRDARACLYLGRLHDAGEGTTRDPGLATHLFELACDGEEPSACVALAERETNRGRFEGASDLYARACSFGDAGACANVGMPVVSLR
jgi:TPR repeat protein